MRKEIAMIKLKQKKKKGKFQNCSFPTETSSLFSHHKCKWTMDSWTVTALNKKKMSSAFLTLNGAIVQAWTDTRQTSGTWEARLQVGVEAASSFCLVLTKVTLITSPYKVKLYWKSFFFCRFLFLIFVRTAIWLNVCTAEPLGLRD